MFCLFVKKCQLTAGNYKSASGLLQNSGQLQNNTINGAVSITINRVISTSNHMFKREIWDKFTEFTFFEFRNLPSKTREISKFQKINEVNFPQISRINM